MFDRVQTELKKRIQGGYRSNPALNTTIFTSIIKCGNYGATFHRKSSKRTDGSIFRVWRCHTNDRKGKTYCAMKGTPEDKIKLAAAEVLGLDEFNEDVFIKCVSQITIPEQFAIIFHLKNGTEVTKHWVCTSKKDSWTPEARQSAASRLGAKNKERNWTPEQRKKLSDAMKARYAEKGDNPQ